MSCCCYDLRQGPLHTYSPLLITHFIITLLPYLSPSVLWIFSFPPSILPPFPLSVSSYYCHSPSLLHLLSTASPGAKRRPPGLLEITILGEPRNWIIPTLREYGIQSHRTQIISLSESGM